MSDRLIFQQATVLALLVTSCLLGPTAPYAQEPRPHSLDAGVIGNETMEGTAEADAVPEELTDGLPAVALATFTSEISNREPVDDISFLGNDKSLVFFFTDLRNLEGQEIRHVWNFNGEDMGTVRFQVSGTRWRVWSSKQLLPDWLGTWTVSVLNAEDEVMATESFTYQDAS